MVVACQAERSDDDVWDLILLMQHLDGRGERFEVGNGSIRKQSTVGS